MAQKITAEMIDWESYKEHLENSIANERIWGLGGSEFADENIEEYEEELYSIENEYYFDILDKYEDDFFEEFLL
jgi:hypothetical protein